MEPIEEKLNQALNCINAPDGFVTRVMARVEAHAPAIAKSFEKPRSSWFEWLWPWMAHPVPVAATAIAMLLALGLFLGYWRHQATPAISQQGRIDGRKASAELMLALEITSSRLSRMHVILSQPPPTVSVPANLIAPPR